MHDLELICRGHQVNKFYMLFARWSFVLLQTIKKVFLSRTMALIFNSHFHLKVVEDGYEFFAKRQLVTLFSAPNYCGEFDNAGGMMTVDESLLCSFQVYFIKQLFFFF